MRWRSRWRLALAQLVLVPGAVRIAEAAPLTIDVTTKADDVDADDGVVSLREALDQANDPNNAGSTVRVPPGNYQLSAGQLTVLGQGTSVTGLGTRASGVLVVAANNSRVFDVQASGVSVAMLTVTGGDLKGRNRGGGIQVQSGASLDLADVQVDGNSAYEGGGLYNDGTVTAWSGSACTNPAGRLQSRRPQRVARRALMVGKSPLGSVTVEVVTHSVFAGE